MSEPVYQVSPEQLVSMIGAKEVEIQMQRVLLASKDARIKALEDKYEPKAKLEAVS